MASGGPQVEQSSSFAQPLAVNRDVSRSRSRKQRPGRKQREAHKCRAMQSVEARSASMAGRVVESSLVLRSGVEASELILQNMATSFNLPPPPSMAPLTTDYQASMDPRHWDASDQEYQKIIREKLKSNFKAADLEYLFPSKQPAEPWQQLEGPTQRRTHRVHDLVMGGVGTMRGYAG